LELAFWCRAGRLLFYLQATGIVQNVLNRPTFGFKLCLVEVSHVLKQHGMALAQFRIAQQGFIDLLLLLARGLVVNKPDQVVLGKGFYHRHLHWYPSFCAG
jgi:hypothetical protein